MQIFVQHNGEQFGPFSLEEVRSSLRARALSGDDLAWHEGLEAWKPLADVLFDLHQHSAEKVTGPAIQPQSVAPQKATSPATSRSSRRGILIAAGALAAIGLLLAGWRFVSTREHGSTSQDSSSHLPPSKYGALLTSTPPPPFQLATKPKDALSNEGETEVKTTRLGEQESERKISSAVLNRQAVDSPEYHAAIMAIGEALRRSGLRSLGDTSVSPDWDAAMKCAKAVVAKYPEFASGYGDLGIIYDNMGFTDQAISAFQQEIKLDPTAYDPWRKLAKIYQDKGKPTQADYALSQAISLCEKEVIAAAPSGELKILRLNTLGDIYRDAGRPDDAIRTYQTITREYGQELTAFHAWQGLAGVYAEQGLIEKAVEAMHNGMADKPYSEAWRVVGAMFLFKKGKDELSEKCYDMAEKLKAQGK